MKGRTVIRLSRRALKAIAAIAFLFGSAAHASDCSDLLGNLASDRQPTRLRHGVYVNAIAWSRDGTRLATLDQREHFLYVWQLPEGRLAFKVPTTSGILRGLTFSADGRFIFTSGFEPSLEVAFQVRNAATGEKIRDVLGPPREQRDGSNNAYVLLTSPSGKHLIVLPFGGTRFSVYSAVTFEREKTVRFARPVKHAAAISQLGTQVAFGGGYGVIEVFNFPGLEPLASFQAELAARNAGPIHGIAFSPDGKIMAVGSLVNTDQRDRQLRLWDTETFQLLRDYDTASHDVRELTYSPDGTYIATSTRGRMRLWDPHATKAVGEYRVSQSTSQPVAYEPNGTGLAFGDAEYVNVCWIKNAH